MDSVLLWYPDGSIIYPFVIHIACAYAPQKGLQMKVDTSRILRAALIGGIVSGIANLIVWVIAHQIGLTLAVPAMDPSMADANGMSQVPFFIVFFASLIPTLIGGGLLALLNRFSANPYRLFQIITIVFVIISMGGVLGAPATGDKIALGIMHVIAGYTAIWAFTSMTSQAKG